MKPGWIEKEIGDVCDLMTGGTPSRSKNEYFENGEIKWLVSGDIHKKEILDCEGRITKLGLENSNAKYLPRNSVLIALNGQGKTRGTVAMLRTKATCNQSLVNIYPKNNEELIPEYIYKYLDSKYKEIREITGDGGNDRRGLNMKIVRRLSIVYPKDVLVQKHIITKLNQCFDAIDKAKANVECNLQNSKELFQSQLNQIFSKKDEGWKKTKLNEIILVKHGFAFKSEFFSNFGEFILLTPGNFYEAGGYRERGDKQKFYVGEIPNGYILNKGDLLIAMTEQAPGLLGSPLLVQESGRYLHNQRLGLIQLKEGVHIKHEFLFYLFNTKQFRDDVYNSGAGVKVRHSSPTKIGEISARVTFDIDTQDSVVRALKKLNNEIKSLIIFYQKKIDALDELKKSILQKAFSSELTITSKEATI